MVRVVGLSTLLWILGVPAPVIYSALFERFESRRLGAFAAKVLNGMRYMFGGHHVGGNALALDINTLCTIHNIFRDTKR